MKKISVEQCASGFRLRSDTATLKTPLGKEMILPTLPLAQAIAAEWNAQGGKIRKQTMPLTQIASITLDLVQEKRAEVYEDIIPYIDTDLICYRAGNIPELLVLQEEELAPVATWAKQTLSIALNITHDIMPVPQPQQNKDKVFVKLEQYSEWQIAVLASVVKPFSSMILAIALVEKYIDSAQAFRLSQLEELYETQKWGEDDEKEQRMQKLKADIHSAGQFLTLLT